MSNLKIMDLLDITIDALYGEEDCVKVSREGLIILLNSLENKNEFDENFYSLTYSDVSDAVSHGLVQSFQYHYQNMGILEGRFRSSPTFDISWYKEHNPELAEIYRKEEKYSLLDHYLFFGVFEGRSASFEDSIWLATIKVRGIKVDVKPNPSS